MSGFSKRRDNHFADQHHEIAHQQFVVKERSEKPSSAGTKKKYNNHKD